MVVLQADRTLSRNGRLARDVCTNRGRRSQAVQNSSSIAGGASRAAPAVRDMDAHNPVEHGSYVEVIIPSQHFQSVEGITAGHIESSVSSGQYSTQRARAKHLHAVVRYGWVSGSTRSLLSVQRPSAARTQGDLGGCESRRETSARRARVLDSSSSHRALPGLGRRPKRATASPCRRATAPVSSQG